MPATAKRRRTVSKVVVNDELTLKVQNTGEVIESYSDNVIPAKTVLDALEIMERVAAQTPVTFELPLVMEVRPSLVDNNGDYIRQGGRDQLRLKIGCQSFNLEVVRKVASIVQKQLNRK